MTTLASRAVLRTPAPRTIPGTLSGRARGVPALFLVTLLVSPAFAAGQTNPFVNLAVNGVGSHPLGVAIGDVNGDGIPDLAVANNSDNTVSVLLGNGDGSYQPARTVPAGSAPGPVALADLNGDGRADLIVGNTGDGTIGVLLSNGDGTFGGAAVYSVGAKPSSIVVGDFTRDGNPDIAVSSVLTNLSGGISLLVGKGDGTFAPPAAIVGYGLGMGPGGLVAADLDNDGSLDLAVTLVFDGNVLDLTSSTPSAVDVLRNDGAGHFTSLGLTRLAPGPTWAAAADFNGDGALDLAVAVSQTTNVAVLLGNGNGTFQSPFYPAAGPNPLQVAVGDINGDGKVDVIAINNNSATSTVTLLLGNGDGSFQPAATYNALPGAIGVAAGDLNRDGNIDLAVTNNLNNSVQAFLGSPSGALRSGVTAIPGFSGSLGFGDLNNDGHLDFAAGTSGGVAIYTGSSAGTFSPMGLVAAIPAPAPLVTVGDFDGDGLPDIVAGPVNSFLTLYSAVGDGTFRAVPTGGADASGTGFLETLNFGKTNYLGVLTSQNLSLTRYDTSQLRFVGVGGFSPGALALADLDGDGFPDAVVAQAAFPGILALFRGLPGGTFNSGAALAASVVPSAGSLTAGDFNGDGIMDLAFAQGSPLGPVSSQLPISGPASLLLGNGDGTLTQQPDHVSEAATFVLSGDFNGDGIADLALSNVPTGSVDVLLGNGDGTFGPPVHYSLGTLSGQLILADVDGDGAPDLAVILPGGMAVLHGTATPGLLRGTSTALTAQPPNPVVGQPIVLSGIVTSTAAQTTIPTGTLDFKESGVFLASDPLSGGQAQSTVVLTSLGTVGFTAHYGGDANFNGSLSGRLALTARPASSATTVALGGTPKLGEPILLTATVHPQFTGTPSGAVQFFIDGQPLAEATLVGAQATATTQSLSMGSHKVEAEYSGDTSFGASLGILTVKIGKAASLVTLSSSANPATVGEPAILTAAVTDSAGTPATGPVVFKEGTTIYGTASVENGEAQIPLPMLSAGTHKITAQYAGDATDSPATSAVLKLTVVGATTSTTLATDTQPAIYGQIVTFTATIESGAGTPDGSVTFKNGSALLGSATIVGGRAQLAVNALGAGTHTIHAFYNGSSRFSASTQSLQQIVEKAGTATTLASSSNPSSLGSPVTFSATLTSTSGAVPTGNVTFEDGAQTLGTVPLVGGEAQWIANALASGSHTITATYDPLGSFAGSKATLAQAVQ